MDIEGSFKAGPYVTISYLGFFQNPSQVKITIYNTKLYAFLFNFYASFLSSFFKNSFYDKTYLDTINIYIKITLVHAQH